MSAGRVRNPKTSYDQADMKDEGAGSWGVARQLPQVAQYIARNPPRAEMAPLPLAHATLVKPTEAELKTGMVVRRQQANSHDTVVEKKKKRTQKKGPKRAATTAAPGEPPAKVAKEAEGSSTKTLPKKTQTVAPTTPVVPAAKEGGGGLFVTPDT